MILVCIVILLSLLIQHTFNTNIAVCSSCIIRETLFASSRSSSLRFLNVVFSYNYILKLLCWLSPFLNMKISREYAHI